MSQTKLVTTLLGTKLWYVDSLLHKEDGPAVEWSDGSKEWHVNGLLHRIDGPAIDYTNGTKYWFLNGKLINCVTQQ